jgi:pyruvate/2-oxoglutarate dehydrogenase complex dihydrolipoamide acyltransferase (E2) component
VADCGNTLILRCAASERGGTSEFASKVIGQREVMQITESRSRSSDKLLPTITTAQHVKIEPAVMASEIERLPDLAGFLRLASNPDWQHVRLTPVRYPSVRRDRAPEASAGSTTAPAAAAPVAAPAARTPAASTASGQTARPSTRKRASAPARRRKRAAMAAETPAASERAGRQGDVQSGDLSAASENPSGPPTPVDGSLGGAELKG